MPCELQAEGFSGVPGFVSAVPFLLLKQSCNKEGRQLWEQQPISVVDTMSPSPSTSTSTLSSSLGGKSGGSGGGVGDGSADNIHSLAAVSDCTSNKKWHGGLLPSPSGILALNQSSIAGPGGLKEEWAAELQPISGGLEVGMGCYGRFGLGSEDWENLLPESTVSPAQDQALLRWISGDIDDPSFSLKQLLQGGNPDEINGNAAFGMANQSSGFDSSVLGCPNNGNVVTGIYSCLADSDSGVSYSHLHNNEKIGAFPNSLGMNINCNSQKPSFSSPPNDSPLPSGANSPIEASGPKTQTLNEVMMNQPQLHSVANTSMFSPSSFGTQQEQHQFQPQLKRHNHGGVNSNPQVAKVPFPELGQEFMLGKQFGLPQLLQPQLGLSQQLNLLHSQHLQPKPLVVPKQEVLGISDEKMGFRNHQQQLLYDQLCEAAELILARNFSLAQGILARLNHQLSSSVKPYQRAAYYFKEALQLVLLTPTPPTSLLPRIPTPFDGMFKMGAYKVLSEVSPLVQFMNFTSNQALLEALDNAKHIHIIDFDIGFGAQWSSFMQELHRKNGGSPSLKITAFASPSTHHPVEIALMHENLTQFSIDIGVAFELEVVNFDSFDPNSYSVSPSQSSGNEVVAVNFPVWSTSSNLSAIPSILWFIRRLSPKIVVSLDLGCELIELPFSSHLRHVLQYYEVLFESIDAANVTLDTANKIEKFLFQPKIESIVLGRLHSADRMLPLKTLFTSAGFVPVTFSNFAQTQAEYVVNRTNVRGFHLEKWQTSLVLCWQRQKLAAASAWSC